MMETIRDEEMKEIDAVTDAIALASGDK